MTEMDQPAPMFGIFDWRKRLKARLQKKSYRDAYVGGHVRSWVAHQIRALRDDPRRNWSQGELSQKLGKPQSVVSRLEDPGYGKMTINTLLQVASAFDVGLVVKFVDFPTFIVETRDLTTASMRVAREAEPVVKHWEARPK